MGQDKNLCKIQLWSV